MPSSSEAATTASTAKSERYALIVVEPKPTATPGWYETWRKRIGIAAASTTAPGDTPRFANLVAKETATIPSPDAPALRPPFPDGRRHLLVGRPRLPRHRRRDARALCARLRRLRNGDLRHEFLAVALRPHGRGGAREIWLSLLDAGRLGPVQAALLECISVQAGGLARRSARAGRVLADRTPQARDSVPAGRRHPTRAVARRPGGLDALPARTLRHPLAAPD